jgi:hypothetical protein
MDSSFFEKNVMNKGLYEKVITAIRMYEIHKNIEALEAMLNSFNMDTNIKDNIIKSVLNTISS